MAAATENLPVAFAALLAGGLLLEHGTSTTKAAFQSSGSTSASPSTGTGQPIAGSPTGTLSPNQIAQLAKQAGFTGQNLQIAVAVALAESGGDTQNKSVNPSPYSVDRGLFQINSLYNADTTDACAYNAVCNTQAAYKYFTTRGWKDWTTYTTGRYQEFMGTAAAAVAAIGGG